MLEITIYRSEFFKQIFKTDVNGKQAIRSLYYQNILRYFLRDPSKYLKVQMVAKSLITVVPIRHRKTKNRNESPSEIIENRGKTLRKYFQELTSWNLLESRETDKEKGSGKTFEYKLTDFGRLIALVIDIDYDMSKNKYDILYQYLLSYFTHESYSLDEFCIRYFEKCKAANLFEPFARNIKKDLIYYNEVIHNEHDFFTYMILLRTGDIQIDEALWKMWKESLSELDPNHRKHLYHNLKLKVENIIEENAENYSEYERIRYAIRDKVGHIPIESYCAKCNDYTKCSYHPVPLQSYLASLFYDPEILTEFLSISKKCLVCNESRFNYTAI